MPEFLNTPEIDVDSSDASSNKVFGILSYINLLWLVGFFAAKDSKYARFHANQGLLLTILSVAVGVLEGLGVGLMSIPRIGWIFSILFNGVGSILGICLTAFMVFGIVFAAKGRAKELPFIGKFHILDK